MKIAHLELGRHLYGGAEQVRYLLSGLPNDEHQHVLVTAAGSALHQWALEAGQSVQAIDFRGEHDLRFIVRFARLLRTGGFDLVHVHSRRGADWMGPMAAALTGTVCIVSRRVDHRPGRLLRWLMHYRYARIICISHAIQSVLTEAGVSEQLLLTINSGVDASRYTTQAASPARELLTGSRGGGPVIAVVAQLIARKGHRYLLEVLPGLTSKFPELQVAFLGKGPLEDALRRQVSAVGLNSTVQFLGFRNDLAALLPAIDLIVHPALAEGLGVSLLQAAAAGVPVVGFAAGGVSQAVADQHSGLLVPPGDAIGMAAAISRVLSDDALRAQLGDNARQRVVRDFSIESMVQRHSALYDVLAGEKT